MPSLTDKCQGFFSFLMLIDFFAMKPSDRITFLKKQTYSTFIGRITTWLLAGIYVATFINFGSDMIYRKNPQSIFSQIVTPDPENLNMKEKGFFMAFGLQDLRNKSSHYIDPQIYTVELIKRTKINGSISLQTIPTAQCDIGNVPNRDDLKAYYQRNNIKSLYCIKNESEIEPELKSTWDGSYYKNLLINIYPCINSTQNGNYCKAASVIESALNSANFAIYFTTEAIDPNNFEKPITSFGKQLYTPISSSTLTYIEMLYGHYNFVTDVGFLFQDIQKVQSAYYLTNRQVLSFSSNMVVQIDMKLDKIKTIYTRKYDKIQNVLADIGGIIKALTIIANFVVLPFIRLNFRLNLANTIFTFKLDKGGKNIIKKIKRVAKSEDAVKPSEKTQTILKEKGHNISIQGKREEYRRNETSQVQISYFRYFTSCLNNVISQTQKNLLNRGLAQIDEVLDISYLMKKIIEIDLLKAILLTDEQRNVFNCLPKPELVLGGETDGKNQLIKTLNIRFGSTTTKPTGKLAEESFQMLMSKNIKSSVDQKLLDLMSSSMTKKRKTQAVEIEARRKSPTIIENQRQTQIIVMESNILNTSGNHSQVNNQEIILFNEQENIKGEAEEEEHNVGKWNRE